ncbi:MAG: ribonuclease R [Pirellulales bacterium]|nr:ribonuclease R [Pirellulales bacterium]
MQLEHPESFEQLAIEILRHVNSKNYQPKKPRGIAKALGLNKEDVVHVRRTIKKLVREGKLTFGASHKVRVADATADDRIAGIFRRTQDGNGYVRPVSATPEAGRDLDIFIHQSKAGDAATGDLVYVRIKREYMRRGKPEGLILEIIERDTNRFVGVYSESAGQGYVDVDGGVFAHSIAVGDPGAKNAQPKDKVVFEMMRFPSPVHPGEGVIIEVLGPRGAPGVDTLSIIHEFHLPGEFDEAVLEEARQQAEDFDEEELPSNRRDLTAETIVTIDPIDARDFDDAISLARLDNGHWLLGVHIADVSHFLPPDSAMDIAARDRATSVYLPDRVIPMLPEILSNGLASLQPDRVRFAKTAFIEFTADGARVAVEFAATAIRSKRRFTYEEVDEYLEDPNAWREKLTPEVHALLARMHELAMMLRKRRHQRGSLELSLPDVRIDLDANGRVSGAHVEVQTESHQIIEEFMLAANEAVAERLSDLEIPFLRRTHSSPSPRKLKALTEFVKELGLAADDLQDRFEMQKLVDEVRGQAEEYAVHYAVLRSLPQAVYSPADEGHFALAAKDYCHFTSPIRRYPDLTVHRLISQLIEGKQPKPQQDNLEILAQHCSELERRAEAAERELTKAKLLSYFMDRIGSELDAVITGVESYGFYARGTEIPAEGLIHVSSLEDDYYQYDRSAHALCGRRRRNQFRLGDAIRVRVVRVDLEQRKLDFRLVRKIKGRPAQPAKRRARGGQDLATKKKTRGKKTQPNKGKTTAKKRKPKTTKKKIRKKTSASQPKARKRAKKR